MFRQTYKTTLKNLFRSGLFWFMLMILIGIAIHGGMEGFQLSTKIHPVTGAIKTVKDTSPEYVLSYPVYIKRIINSVLLVMNYAMPLIAIVSTVLILNRDYGDNFYEIEKGAGISPAAYFFGRIAALITVNFSLVIIASLVSFHTYIITRGGVSSMGTLYYITDSSIRLMRIIVFIAFPSILFYVGVTFLFGCILHSGLSASIVSIAYIVFNRLQPRIRGFIPPLYEDYFSPLPHKLTNYLYWYDTYSFNPNLSLKDAALAFLFQPAVFLLTLIVSYILIRKRDK